MKRWKERGMKWWRKRGRVVVVVRVHVDDDVVGRGGRRGNW